MLVGCLKTEKPGGLFNVGLGGPASFKRCSSEISPPFSAWYAAVRGLFFEPITGEGAGYSVGWGW